MRFDGLAAARWATLIVCGLGLLATPAWAQAEPTFDQLVAQWKKEAGSENYAKVWEAAQAAIDKRMVAEAERSLSSNKAEQDKKVKEREAAETEAIPLLKKSIGLGPADSPETREDIVSAQLQLAFFSYQKKDLTTAAVLAEHVARTFSDHSQAGEAAKIAAACRAMQYNAVPKEQKEAKAAALDKLVAINEFIGTKWGDRPEGSEAWGRLAQLALATGDASRVETILAKLPADSPARWEIGLRLNLSEWSDVLKLRSLPDDDAKKPADLDARITAVQKKLVENTTKYRAANAGAAPFILLAAELTISQIHNLQGRPEEALKVLKIANTGLLAQANANSPAVQEGSLGPKIYETALQAYLATQDVDQAEAMAEKMSGGGDAKDLVKLRLSLAKRLNEDVAKLRETNGDPAQLEKKLAGLTSVLKKVVAEASTADFPSVAWAGQTMIKLAQDGDSGDVEPKPVVKDLYQQAATLFEKLLERSKSAKPDTAEGKSLNAVRVNLAKSYRRLGKFEQAVELLDTVLDDAPNNLDAQVAAAQAYQDWGAATNDAKYYNYAVRGGPDVKLAVGVQKSPILGWSRLATKLADSSKGRDRLFEVRYNLAFSMASAALLNTKKAEQTAGLNSAEQQILGTHRVDREMGGPALKAKYEQLLKIIQTKLGKPANGLPQENAAPPAKAAS